MKKDIYFAMRHAPVVNDYKEQKAVLAKWSHRATADLMTIKDAVKMNNETPSVFAACRFNAKFRPAVGTWEHRNLFNKVVFIDFDFKMFDLYLNFPDTDDMYNYMVNKLLEFNSFYYFENSLHTYLDKHDSAHFFFYYEGVTIDNYESYYNLSKRKVTEAYNDYCAERGLKPLIVSRCIDRAAANPSHLTFLTLTNCVFNEACDGTAEPAKIDMPAEPEPVKRGMELTVTLTHKSLICRHLPRAQRWKLFANMAVVIPDPDKLKAEWTRIMTEMTPGKHNAAYYIKEPYKCGWVNGARSLRDFDKYLLMTRGIIINDITTELY